ncbi:hypothetical protein L7F22_008668 [Adiantum nelumboides]|nr:hypothetical protein [Adiantum nelumboides]
MRRSVGASRPLGTDGTDHPYRMTVDIRYKKVVEKKLQLHKLLVAQSFLMLQAILKKVYLFMAMMPSLNLSPQTKISVGFEQQSGLKTRLELYCGAVFHMIKAVQVVLMLTNMEPISRTTVVSCFFGGAAVLFGTVGLRWTSSRLLQLFLFATGAALMLSILPFLLGYIKVFRSFQGNTSYKILVLDGLEVAQEIVGVMLQLFEISVSLSLLQHLSRRRT